MSEAWWYFESVLKEDADRCLLASQDSSSKFVASYIKVRSCPPIRGSDSTPWSGSASRSSPLENRSRAQADRIASREAGASRIEPYLRYVALGTFS